MIERELAEKKRDELMSGIQGKYVKRRGQIDAFTHNNKEYRSSLAHNKYILKGSQGNYSKKIMSDWHANIDQTILDKNYHKIAIKK